MPVSEGLKIGLALGGGGARGLAHIPMLQVLDELGIRPHRIAGTSIGAVIGAIYASGVTGMAIREGTDRMLIKDGDTLRDILANRDALASIRLLDIDFLGNALFKGDAFVEFLYRQILTKTFGELHIPLRVVATNFWNSTQEVFSEGDLLKAIKASMGLPGVFSPVHMDGMTLIDGGCVNPLPHDILGDCDVVIAVNVMGRLEKREGRKSPTAFRAVLETFNIMQRSIISEKLAKSPPTIYIEPDISNVDLLEFHKAPEIYAQAEKAARELRDRLLALRTGPGKNKGVRQG
ncbi:MAG: patatin-like phospholipase family protein [Candidatus Fermentibacteraceae bacterium]